MSTLICPLRMVVESTFSLVGLTGQRKACHDQLAIISRKTCSKNGYPMYAAAKTPPKTCCTSA